MEQQEIVARKFQALASCLDERSRRLWVGAEAEALGRGGVALVARATGMAISTVRKGRDELRSAAPLENLVKVRRRGAGRPSLEKKQPEMLELLHKLVAPGTRGDPQSPLRWTLKSTRALARELTAAGYRVSAQKVSELLRALGYSLQGTSKVKEGEKHPDRDAQFEHIKSRVEDHLMRGQPVISVDTKKKENVGEYARAGTEWQPKGKPVEVQTYDFHEEDGPKVAPYGVYDVGANTGFVNVGIDHDTPRFAVKSIQKWWELIGRERYPSTNKLFITADSGGSNSAVSRVWKAQLQRFADLAGLTIEVSHFPPGTSKWNKIEHRLFSFITLNWRGRPLISYETVVSLIGATKTSKGLTVQARLDEELYPLGEKVPKRLMAYLALEQGPLCGAWNYSLTPRSPELIASAEQAAQTLPHRKKIRARWKALVDAQIASGLNSAQFCAKRELKYAAFILARRKLKGVLQPNVSKARRAALALIKAKAILDE